VDFTVIKTFRLTSPKCAIAEKNTRIIIFFFEYPGQGFIKLACDSNRHSKMSINWKRFEKVVQTLVGAIYNVLLKFQQNFS